MRQIPTDWLKKMPIEFTAPNSSLLAFFAVLFILIIAYLVTKKDQ